MIQAVNSINNQNIYFRKNNLQDTKVSTSTKVASSVGSVAGIVTALAVIAKKRSIKVVPPVLSIKGAVDIFKKIEFNEKDVIGLASSSILGGFLGGVITDSKNKKAKAKEGVVQLVGNYIIPSLFVGAGIKLNKVLNNKYKFPPITKPIQFAFGFTSLIVGVIFGNKVSKEINSRIFKEDDYRKLTWKDWAVQFDNACLVTSMSTAGTILAKVASRIIPVAHLIPGYLVGVQAEKN